MSPLAGGELSHWVAETEPSIEESTVASILRSAAAEAPDVVALIEGAGVAGDRRFTYSELLAWAEWTAEALLARFDRGERICVCASAVPESLVLTYAAALAGLVLVPVNPALRDAELDHVLRQSGTVGAFVARAHRGEPVLARFEHLAPGLPALREVALIDELPDTGGGGGGGGPPGPLPGDVAQIVYTSGTTGAPKGACLTHRGMTNAARLAALRFGVRPGDVYVDSMPMYHVGGQVVAFQICQRRATCVLLPAFDPGLVLRLVERERATITVGVPTMLIALIEHPEFDRADLSSLRAVSSGGSVVPPALVRRIESSLGVQFAVVFGQTEACGFISQTHLDDDADDKASTLGQPLPHVSARVADSATGEILPTGGTGELQVDAPFVMAGYHDLPGPSAEAFTPDGWLRTGDLVTMDGRGYLRIAGRLRDMITTGGENVYPAEVEAVLGTHPDITQAAVLGLEDAHWGERVVAVVVASRGSSPDPMGLQEWLRERLAPYKVPKEVVITESLPLTASGKVQKFVLREHLEARP